MLASQELRDLFADYMNIRETGDWDKHKERVRQFARKLVEEFKEFAKASTDIASLWETFEAPLVDELISIEEEGDIQKLSESSLPDNVKKQIRNAARQSKLSVEGIAETNIKCPRCLLEGKKPAGKMVFVFLRSPAYDDTYTTLICGQHGHYGGKYLEESYLTVIDHMVRDSLELAAKKDAWKAKLLDYYQKGWFTHEYAKFGDYLQEVKKKLEAPISELIPAIEALLNFTHGRGMLLDTLFGHDLAQAWRRKERWRQLRRFILKSVADALKSRPPAAT